MKKSIRRYLCILLSAALLLPAVGVAASGEESELKLFVASDIHYRPSSSLGDITAQNTLPGDALYSHTNTKSMLSFEADAIIDEFLSRFEGSDADILLIPGDLSEEGYWDEHLGLAEKLNEFKARTGKRIFVIPGNHDIRTSDSKGRLNAADFEEIYYNLGFSEAVARHDGSLSYTADLDAKHRLIAVDACIYRQDGSRLSDDLLQWIKNQALTAAQAGMEPILMVHFSVLEHIGIQGVASNLLCLDNYREAANVFADCGIRYCFTGHEHANDISSAVSDSGNTIYDIETGCLLTYPNAYREVAFSDAAVSIKTNYIDKIDTSLLPEGFTAEQLELMNTDFPKYSYDYFRAGMRSYAYMIPDATAELAGELNIEEGTAAYAALGRTMDTLCEAARLPLYDSGTAETDSVEELAREAGITLEESEYRDVLDVAGVIYAGHYAGDESLGFDSKEVRLLGQGLRAILLYALMNVPHEDAALLIESFGIPADMLNVSNSEYTELARVTYMKTAADFIANQVLASIADGVVTDCAYPADLNVTLTQSEPDTVPDNLVVISDFYYYIDIIIRYVTAILDGVMQMKA